MTAEPAKLSYTVPEAAKAIGCSKATVWRQVKQGELSTFRGCGRTLSRADVLRAAMDRASGVAA